MTRFQNDTWRRLAGKNRSPERRASRTAKASASSHSARRGRVPAGPSALPDGRDEVPGRIVEHLFRPARVQLARDLYGSEQALAAGCCLKRQPQERGPVLAQVAITRGQFIYEPAL